MKYAYGAILLLAAMASTASAVDPLVLQAERERIEAMDKARPAVLAIFPPEGGGGGSGVVISADGYALTNFHVVQPCGNFMKCGMPDGRLYDAVLVGLDPTGDVALVKLAGRSDFPAATLGDSDQVQAGDWVFAMGNPFGLATDFQPTATYGIVSGVHRYQYPAGTLLEYADCIQTDASINPGNSGGPLFDARARLIGINGRASFEKRGRVNVGVGYAISINQIKNFLGGLKAGRIVDHATLGARLGFDEQRRVVVDDILESCDAYRRGLRYGDEIISFGGRPIDTPNGFKNVLGIFPKGWRVPLSYRHEGKRVDVLVRLSGVHSEQELIDKVSEEHSPMPLPKPKPEKSKPERSKPGKKAVPEGHPSDEPDDGIPMIPGLRRRAPPPAALAKVYEARRGYANYYFNRENRQRVWKAWAGRCDLAAQDGLWTITGHTGTGTAFTLQLSDDTALLSLPTVEWKWNTADGLDAAMAPPGSAGLLLAVHLWRRLAVAGVERYGEVSYLGTAPVAGQPDLADVLSGSHAGVECRFSFRPSDGDLLALELIRSDDADPCLVYFAEPREVEGRWLPGSMDVRVGDELFGSFKFETFQFAKAAKKPQQ